MRDKPALKAAFLLIAGIVLGRYLLISASVLRGVMCGLLLISVLYHIFRPVSLTGRVLAAAALLWLGCFRYQMGNVLFPSDHIVNYTDYEQTVIIRGFLDRDPDVRADKTIYEIDCKSITVNDTIRSVRGKIRMSAYRNIPAGLQYGDEIVAAGILKKPRGRRNPGGFDYRAYLAGQSVFGILKPASGLTVFKTHNNAGSHLLRSVVYPVRRSILSNIDRMMRGECGALMKALLTGDRGGLTPELRDDFSKAGVIHVLAVSGLHVGFVCMILLTLFGLFRFPYVMRVILTVSGLIFFALLTEARAPVVRASFMASLFLLGTLLEREVKPLNIIGVSALVMLLVKPGDLFQIGFQLSFGAVSSIVYFYSRISSSKLYKRILGRSRFRFLKHTVMPMMLVSLSAQLGTLPLTAVYFNRIPLLSMPANLVAIPVIGLIVALGLTSVMIAPVSLNIAMPYATCAQVLLSLFIALFRMLGRLNFSHISVPTPDGLAILLYGAVLILAVHFNDRILRKRLILIVLILLNCSVWRKVANPSTNKLVWVQFDVGQGDAALLRMPRGKNMLIDGGAWQEGFDQGERVVAPYLRRRGIRRLDAVVLSHPHNDHVGGLIYILNHFTVRHVYTAGTVFDSGLYNRFLETIENRHIPCDTICAPDSLLFPGVRVYFLSPSAMFLKQTGHTNSQINNQSLVMRMQYGRNVLLFTGDAEKPAEYDMLNRGLLGPCDAVKAGHHGSRTSSSDPFVRQIKPDYSVISVGENNRFGHPSADIIQRYTRIGAQVLRTDVEGAVIFRLDGEKVERVMWK